MKTDAYTRYREWATKPSAAPTISIVIPAYNEEERILPTIGAIAAHMCSRPDPWELIVADDGSQDSTIRLVTGLKFPNMRVLVAEQNGGKGSAVRRGFAVARGEYVLLVDADQSTPIEQFDLLLDPLINQGYDVAVGSRAAKGANVSGKNMLRRVLSAGLRMIVRTFFGIRIRDTQCGFKLFRSSVAHDLFARQQLDGFAFDLELLYLCNRRGYTVAEIPVDWIDAPGSKVDEATVVARFVKDLLVIWSNDRRGRYAEPRSRTVPAPRTER